MTQPDVSRVIAVDGKWRLFRQAGVGHPPLWLSPGSTYVKPQPSGRWHVEGEGYAQYLAPDEDAAWAEHVRRHGVRTEDERCHFLLRLWRMRVVEQRIADLSTFDRIEESGLDPARFVDDDHTYCQHLAFTLRGSGFRGVLAPSAAHPGAVNFTLFGSRRECKMGEPNPRLDHYVPCKPIADRTVPPPHVLDITRYRGEPHLGLVEWEAGKRAKAA
jgi:RES domain-containing protein